TADAVNPVPSGLEWFWEKYNDATEEIVAFCEACDVRLADRDVADFGCGEGSMALGLHRRVAPRRLVGFDLKPVDVQQLSDNAKAVGVSPELPLSLEFCQSTASAVPAEQDEFDFVYSWSAFEHVSDPVVALDEVRRVLRQDGHFFLQLWPFYFSAKGSHLWQWYEQDFHHLSMDERDVVAQVLADDRQPREWAEYVTHEFERLNRVTLDQLQRSVLAAGFDVLRIELISLPTTLTPSLARYSWTDLAISGIKLLAELRR
ncbi:MAG TPA: class I SAM-dependent methyltransferase, partial [Solirubrobacteraceae bacterium]|nr:class I SAM-dependent methyltransferase [Solirubrobacteraceae bacterium]